jgi:ribosomal protein S12
MIRLMPFAGQDVATSGVYRVVHAGHNDQDTDCVLIRGQKFPRCAKCDYGVHYTLIHAAPSAGEVAEFRPKAKAKKAKQA